MSKPGTITFRVDAIPVGQPRHKFDGRTKRTFLPSDHPVHAFKAHVQIAARQAGAQPITTPVTLVLRCYFPRPNGHYRTKKGVRTNEIKPNAETYKTSTPDCDNIMKAVCDALNTIAWKDDAQVIDARAIKRYETDDHPVGVEVIIRELSEFQ